MYNNLCIYFIRSPMLKLFLSRHCLLLFRLYIIAATITDMHTTAPIADPIPITGGIEPKYLGWLRSVISKI